MAGAPGPPPSGDRRGPLTGTDLGRRRFLLGGGLAAAAAGAGVWAVRAGGRGDPLALGLPSSEAATLALPGQAAVPLAERETTLVVVQLGGGNDALGTLIPSDGRYVDARPVLAVPESQRLALAGASGYSLHPALAPLLPLWDAGSLAAVAGVAMAGQTRSHFEALDAWWSAGQGGLEGWLGRWLDATEHQDPGNPLRAVALGGGSPALFGDASYPLVVHDPGEVLLRTPRAMDPLAFGLSWLATSQPLAGDPLTAAAQQAVPAALRMVFALEPGFTEAAEGANDTPPSEITTLLRAAGVVIDQGLGTRVVHVSAGGFDTHAYQNGAHPPLLADLARGLAELHATAASGGWADKLLVITVSDFGRRLADNGSGTDHGNAGLQLVSGQGVDGGRVVGGFDLGDLSNGDVAPVLDGRSVYAAALDWLGGPTDEILGGSHDRLGLLA